LCGRSWQVPALATFRKPTAAFVADVHSVSWSDSSFFLSFNIAGIDLISKAAAPNAPALDWQCILNHEDRCVDEWKTSQRRTIIIGPRVAASTNFRIN
jgi:hypothetical protein